MAVCDLDESLAGHLLRSARAIAGIGSDEFGALCIAWERFDDDFDAESFVVHDELFGQVSCAWCLIGERYMCKLYVQGEKRE